MSIVNIPSNGNYETKENVVQQIKNHNEDTKAHNGMSFPANGGNADTVDGKHAADLQNYNNLTNKPTSMKNPYSLTVQFNGTSQKIYDGSAAQTLNITPSGIGAAAGSHTHSYSSLTNIPTSLPANGGNADTVDGKHASNFVTDSPTEANKYTTVLSWALAQNQSGVAYSSADSSLSNAEDKPSNGQYGQFHYLVLKGETYRRTVMAFEYGATGHNIYRRSITVNAWYGDWVKINDGGNADTVDGHHAYQLQNCDKDGNPETTYLKSAYDESKGKFYLKSYLSSGQNGVGVYVDYAANSDMFQDKDPSYFMAYRGYIDDSTVHFDTLLEPGIYNIALGDFDSTYNQPEYPDGHAVYTWGVLVVFRTKSYAASQIYISHNGDCLYRCTYNANEENKTTFREWKSFITSDLFYYRDIAPDYISNGVTVMVPE